MKGADQKVGMDNGPAVEVADVYIRLASDLVLEDLVRTGEAHKAEQHMDLVVGRVQFVRMSQSHVLTLQQMTQVLNLIDRMDLPVDEQVVEVMDAVVALRRERVLVGMSEGH